MAYQECNDLHGAWANQTDTISTTRRFMRDVYCGLVNYLARRRQQKLDRDAFRNMLLLDDDILDDIGVTRSNVEWASQLPMHLSAAQELRKTSLRARPKIRP